MINLPQWAEELLKRSPGPQVSHGLNLALPLKNKLALPLLLWDIAVAQPQIRVALENLDFVHFARFVPSWDGSALMVITEFDGPLEPYVQDFVIPLGEVFDRLLSYVDPREKPPPPASVRADPEGFLAFVKAWNRVPLAQPGPVRFPESFDYPLFSAYPDKTVADIVGPRRYLPPPALDPEAPEVELGDIQGNILRGYKAAAASHVFCEIVDAPRARQWLATVPDLADPASGRACLGTARPWATRPSLMMQVGLTHAGLELLLPERQRRGDLDCFPAAFREGALKRAASNHDVGDSAPCHWQFGRQDQAIHLVVSVYAQPCQAEGGAVLSADDDRARSGLLQRLTDEAAEHGLRVLHRQEAHGRPDGREYFGFRDGLTKPRVRGLCQAGRDDHQPAASAGEFVLGEQYPSRFGGPSIGPRESRIRDLLQNGSFAAMRLLEQDVEAFDDAVAVAAAELKVAPALVEAKLMGRWKDTGEPVSLHPDRPGPGGEPPRNDFDHAPSWEHPDEPDDHFGQRCPVGAHIRRVNPRSARVAGQRHSRRLLRRGMPSTWQDPDHGERQGLLGLFFCASLEHQFEFIQQQWIHGDIAASGIRGEQDPIAGQRSEPARFTIPGLGAVTLPPLVKTRGSLYLFYPGLTMLRQLDPERVLAQAALAPDGAAADTAPVGAPTPLAWVSQSMPDLVGLVQAGRDRALPGGPDADQLAAAFSAPWRSTSAPRDVPVASPEDLDPLDPRFVANPFERWRALIEEKKSPLVYVPGHAAVWVLDVALVQQLLDRHEDFLQQPSAVAARGILTADGEQHERLRQAFELAFRQVVHRIPGLVDAACQRAVRALGGRREFDFVASFSRRVPREVFWSVFAGDRVAESDRQRADAWVDTLIQVFEQPEPRAEAGRAAALDASLRLAALLAAPLARAVAASLLPGFKPETIIDGVAEQVVVLKSTPERTLRAVETVASLVQVVLAGMSSHFLLGSAVHALLSRDPRQPRGGPRPWDALVSKGAPAAGIALALAEARRISPPVTIVPRYAARDGVSLGAYTFKKDTPVFAVLGAAHRQAQPGKRPDEFHFDRPANDIASLPFGTGIHECVGMALQQALVPPALAFALETWPGLRLARPDAVPPWVDNVFFRDLRALSVSTCPPA